MRDLGGTWELWVVIAGLAIGSFTFRFLFLGLMGGRALSPWLLRHLRYTAVGIIPALVTPLVIWPSVTEGTTEPARLSTAIVTIVIGVLTKNVIYAILAGATTLAVVLASLG